MPNQRVCKGCSPEKMLNQRVCKGCSPKKMPNQRVCEGCSPKKMPNQRVCKGCFQNLMPIRRVCKGCLGKKHTSNVFFGGGFFPNHPFARCFSEAFLQITLSRVVFRRLFPKPPLRALFLGSFFSNHPFARCFWEAFFQTTLSRVVFGKLFSKSPFRALFLGGFSSKTAFPCAWKCCFRWVVARLDVKNGKAHRDLFFLCGLFQSFASQLFSHVACFHIHVIDVFFAIVAA